MCCGGQIGIIDYFCLCGGEDRSGVLPVDIRVYVDKHESFLEGAVEVRAYLVAWFELSDPADAWDRLNLRTLRYVGHDCVAWNRLKDAYLPAEEHVNNLVGRVPVKLNYCVAGYGGLGHFG